MSLFPSSADTETREALAEGRTVFFVGQRRSGLTHWVRTSLRLSLGDGREARYIDLSRTTALPALIQEIASALGSGDVLREPSDVQTASVNARDLDIILCNAHRLSPEALEWLLRALLDRIGGGDRARVRFIVEGAIDIDDVLFSVFPQGLSANPLVFWAEPATPWVTMGQLERFISSRARRYPNELLPWVVDYARGDLGFTAEFLERLPRTGPLNNETIGAAWTHVTQRGGASMEIRKLIEPVLMEPVVALLAAGAAVRDLAPPNTRSPILRRLYLGGVVAYDPMMESYSVRSPAAAHIVAGMLDSPAIAEVVEASAIHARTSYLIWKIAAVELQMRAKLRGADWIPRAESTWAETPWAGRSKAIRAAAHAKGLEKPSLQILADVMQTELPDRVSIMVAVRERLKVAEAGGKSSTILADGLTFSEMVNIARSLDLINDLARTLLAEINRGRNDVAHFRGMNFDRAMALLRAISEIQPILVAGGQEPT